MRIRWIQHQGIRSPRGERRLALDPAFNLVLCRDAAEARDLLRLLEALLHPDDGLVRLRGLADPAAEVPARVQVSLSLGRESYRLVADLDRPRVVLGRYDAGAGRFSRIAADPAPIRARLEAAGVPAAEDFGLLHVCGLAAAEADVDGARPTPGERVDAELRDELRLRSLERGRARLAQVEAELKEVEVELERCAPLADALEDLDARLSRVRGLEDERHRERSALEASRRELLEERRRLRAVPGARVTGIWLGAALGAAGTAAGALVGAWLYAASLIGVGIAGTGLARIRAARGALARVDSQLAALRVRESALERRLAVETAPLRKLERALGVDSIEGLEAGAQAYRARASRAEALRRDLEVARADYPAEAEQELRAIQARLAAPLDPVEPDPGADPVADPSALVGAAARAGGVGLDAVHARLRPTLPIYLRALTEGAYSKAGHVEGEGWRFRRGDWKRGAAFAELPERDRPRVALAVRLALLETLAPELRVPLLVGPDLEPDDPTRLRAAVRVLQRLGAAVQVIAFGGEPGWSAVGD